MKKYLTISLTYAVAAMVAGVFYREFTKWHGFTDTTTLGKVHTHLFALGMIMFLIVAIFTRLLPVEKEKTFRTFMVVYNIGVPLMAVMMVTKGITQVLDLELSKAMNSAISGISGLGHMLLGVGLILLLVALIRADRVSEREKKGEQH